MSGRLSHIMNAVYCEPWLIRPEMHQTISGIVQEHVKGVAHLEAGCAATFELPGMKEESRISMVEDVAVISFDGVVGKRVGMLEKTSGVLDLDDFAADLEKVASDDGVDGIVLDINSPGGTVTGTPEAADMVAKCRKRVVAYSETMCASAAYWVASQAYAFIAAPSAVVGSIGVYLPLSDRSRLYEMNGVKQHLIKAGKYKGIGVDGTAPTEEMLERLQDRVDFIHAEFKAAVRAGRGNIADEHMEGQDFFGKQAEQIGLVDSIGTLAQAIRLAAGNK